MKKFFKILGWILLLLLILLLVLMFVMPTKMNVEYSKKLDAPKNMVFNSVNDLNSWETWNPWKQMDETLVMTLGEKTSGDGASYSWTSENMGSGTYTVSDVVSNKSLKTNLNFDGQGEGLGSWNFEEDDGKTKATWGFEFEMGRPMNLMAPFMKRSIKKSFKTGFKSLEKFLEERIEEKVYNGHKIIEIAMPEKHFVMSRSMIPMDNIQQFYSTNLGSLFGKLQRAGKEMDGMPCGLYFKWDEETNMTDMAAAIPVSKPASIKGASSYTIPEKTALQIDYYGDYKEIVSAHMAMDAYLKDYGLVSDMPVIEEYVTDPGDEPDPSKWLTKVTYYLGE